MSVLADQDNWSYTVACILNFNWAVLIFPCASKYQLSQSSGYRSSKIVNTPEEQDRHFRTRRLWLHPRTIVPYSSQTLLYGDRKRRASQAMKAISKLSCDEHCSAELHESFTAVSQKKTREVRSSRWSLVNEYIGELSPGCLTYPIRSVPRTAFSTTNRLKTSSREAAYPVKRYLLKQGIRARGVQQIVDRH